MDDISLWHNYGLDAAPFEDRASNLFHCPLPQWQEAFHALHRLAVGDACSPTHTSRLALVVGGFGTGKSVLLAQFLTQIESNLPCCLIRGNPSINVIDLSLALATRFKFNGIIDKLRQADKEQQLKLLIKAATQHQPQQNYLLVIDDAHRLPAEVLTALLWLVHFQAVNKQNAFSLLLAGDLKLKARLAGLSNEVDKIWVGELMPLDKENTKMYLDYRLKCAGWRHASPFDEASVTRIHRLSGGIPGRINRVAEQVLLQCLTEQSNTKTTCSFSSFSQPSAPSNALEPLTQPYTLSSAPSLDKPRLSSIDHYLNTLYIKGSKSGKLIYEKIIKKQFIGLLSLSFLIIVSLTFSKAKLFTKPTLLSLKSVFSHQLSAKKEYYRSLLSLYPTYNAPTTPSVNLSTLPKLRTATTHAPTAKQQPQLSSRASMATPYRLINQDEKELLSKNQGYAVQLMAVPMLDSLIAFLKKQHLYATYRSSAGQFDEPSPHIFQGMSQHHAFYALIYGPFDTQEDAQMWIDEQSSAIQTLQPWIRPFTSVKYAIRQRNRSRQG